ncbi:hypothetical protein C8J56DRAFT_185933 [Mycena floridula]|nr:hypothetical protein C8J56DRAFT_185933 [Mycena floridula]
MSEFNFLPPVSANPSKCPSCTTLEQRVVDLESQLARSQQELQDAKGTIAQQTLALDQHKVEKTSPIEPEKHSQGIQTAPEHRESRVQKLLTASYSQSSIQSSAGRPFTSRGVSPIPQVSEAPLSSASNRVVKRQKSEGNVGRDAWGQPKRRKLSEIDQDSCDLSTGSTSEDMTDRLTPPNCPPGRFGHERSNTNYSGESQCANCATTHTPMWRRGADNQLLCNACALYHKLHKRPRPSMLPKPVKGIQAPRVGECAQCHTRTTPMWRKDALQRTVCNACGLRKNQTKTSYGSGSECAIPSKRTHPSDPLNWSPLWTRPENQSVAAKS